MADQDSKNNLAEGDHGKIWTQWEFPEYVQYKRTKSWFIWFGLIIAGLLIFAIYDNNPLFAIIIVMAGLIIFFQGRKKPSQVDFKISEDGILLNDKIIEYTNITKFWIIYNPPEVKELFFAFKNKLRPELSIPLYDLDPVKIREYLLKYLEEDATKEHEGFSRGLRRNLKF